MMAANPTIPSPGQRADEAARRGTQRQRIFTGIALACIVATYIFTIVKLHPTNLFGLTGDDGIYMSSAKALAEGKGYVLPNLPGSPPATKYPVLYPWMLSLVWHLNPSFPANLPLAIAISAIFGVGFLLAAFAMFSNLGGLGRTESLILTAYCALHPLVMFYGASVLSEMPFAFFALASMLVADRVMRPKGGRIGSASCGALAGIAALTRILGFPIILGIVVVGILRRSWRQLAAFGLAAAPFVGLASWNAVFSTKPAAPFLGAAGQSLGWTRAWTFYTDYTGMWKLGVPNLHIFWAMLRNNAGMMLRQPADLLLGPALVRDTIPGRVLVVLTAVVVIAGIVRQAREHGWKPIHFSLAFYAPVVFLWNYPAVNRFFLPFWPLLMAGAWIEGKRVMRLVRSTMLSSRQMAERCMAVAVGLVVVALACAVAQNSVYGMRSVVNRTSEDRQELLQDKRETYEWIRAHAEPNARLVAYEDAATYLYTGRETVRPIIFATDGFYEPKRLDLETSHLTDVAEAIGAQYWLFASDDYYREWPAATAFEVSQIGELEGEIPVVFRSSHGVVKVRNAMCLSGECGSACTTCEKTSAEKRLVGEAPRTSALAR